MVSIVGWGHTPFGKLEQDLETLIRDAGAEALAHAGVAPRDVDGIWLGHFNGGMVDDGFVASMALGIHDDLRFKPATRLENACASGSAAIYAARNAILAGEAKIALVIGVEKMTHLSTAGVTAALGRASYQAEESGVSFPQAFAQFAQNYFNNYGDQTEALARIASKNHANAMDNPLAQLHKPLPFEFCRDVSERNPMIASPLKMSDCSLVSDGAAALVLASDDVAAAMPRVARLRAAEQVNDYLPMSRKDLTQIEGAAEAIRRAYLASGVALDDLHVAEVHDCFTIAELLLYEGMGLAPKGQGASVISDGISTKDGKLPVNRSGGLKAKGHPVGATGVSMHAMIARQVLGEADAMQIEGASLGLVVNMGGSGVANYATIIEAEKRA